MYYLLRSKIKYLQQYGGERTFPFKKLKLLENSPSNLVVHLLSRQVYLNKQKASY